MIMSINLLKSQPIPEYAISKSESKIQIDINFWVHFSSEVHFLDLGKNFEFRFDKF